VVSVDISDFLPLTLSDELYELCTAEDLDSSYPLRQTEFDDIKTRDWRIPDEESI